MKKARPAKKRKALTEEKQTEVRRFIRSRLARRYGWADIIDLVSQKFAIAKSTAENYVIEVRGTIKAQYAQDIEDHRSDSLEFYNSIIRDPKNKASDRIRAQAYIDRLLGLPKQPAISINLGVDLNDLSSLSDDELDQLIGRAESLARRTGET